MLRKLNSLLVLFAFTILVIAASSAMAQKTLGCCNCVGGTNTLDLSTVSSNSWTVNGSPVVFLSQTQINPAWNYNTGSAQWVSTSAGGGNGSAGNFDFELPFAVPNCTIPQKITVTGTFGADNNVDVYLTSIAPANKIGSCSG